MGAKGFANIIFIFSVALLAAFAGYVLFASLENRDINSENGRRFSHNGKGKEMSSNSLTGFAENPFRATLSFVQEIENDSAIEPNTGEDQNTVHIKMSEEGYVPQDIEIEEGNIAIFENIGKKVFWPASNIHPTHQIYPEFDPLKGIFPGEKWSFQFNKAGQWRYHDHMFPHFRGVVIVKEKNVALKENPVKTEPFIPNEEKKQALPSGDQNTQDRFSSVNMMDAAKQEKELNYWLAAVGAKRVLEKVLEDAGGGSLVDCHSEAHNVGRVGYEIYGASVFRDGNASCHSGYYHGAMESFLKEKGTLNLAEDISQVCDEFATSFGRFECLHGVGHGVLAYVDYDMPESIKICESLDSDYSRSACLGGMFMENIVTAQGRGNSPGHTTSWANQDPHFPCNAISNDYMVQYQCYLMQTSWMLSIFNYDFSRVKEECVKSPSDMISVCFKSFGRDAAGHTLRNPQKIVEICGMISNIQQYYDECITGAVNVIIDFWGGGLKNQANELCRLLPREGKNACYSTVAYRLRDVFGADSERQVACAGFEEQYKNLCAP